MKSKTSDRLAQALGVDPEPLTPQLDLIERLGAQFDSLRRGRRFWFAVALIGWVTSAWLYCR